MAMKKLRARVHTGRGENFTIKVTCRRSGIELMNIEIPIKQLGKCLFGTGDDVTVEMQMDTQFVGSKAEHKDVQVWIARHEYVPVRLGMAKEENAEWKKDHECKLAIREGIHAAAVAPHLKGGWTYNIYDLANNNNIDRKRKPPEGKAGGDGDWFNVGFHRFVK